MKRLHLVLGGLLGLQLLLILVLRLPLGGREREVAAATPLLPADVATDVARIQIEDSDEGRVTLVRRDDRFVVEEADGFPADASRVDKLLADLRGLRVRRAVVSTPRHHAAFKVADDDFEARVRLWTDPDGEPTVAVLVGTSSSAGGSHIRRGDDAAVYEARDLSAYDLRTDPSAWIDRAIFDVAVDTIDALEITNGRGTFALTRTADSWNIASPNAFTGRAVDSGAVDNLLRALTQLRWTEAAGRPDPTQAGLAAPSVVVEISTSPRSADSGAISTDEAETLQPRPAAEATATPQRHTLRVGGPVQGRESERYAMRSGLDLAGTIWDSSLTPLLEAEISGLLAKTQP